MYVEFYGLSRDPFSSISSRHIRLSASQRKAIADLHYGLEYGHQVQLLLADSGLGKTTLLRYLEARLKTDTRSSRFFLVDSKSFESVTRVVSDLDAPSTTVLSRPTENIVWSRTSENETERSIILLIDDAHALSDADLRRILLLTKVDVTKSNHVFIILAGRLELLDKLRRLSFSNSFKETRIAPLDSDEVGEYVKHRLRLASGEHEPILTPAAIAVIARQSRGVPEEINNLCQAALATGVKHQLKQVDAPDLDTDRGQASSQPISQQLETPYAVMPSTIASPRGRSALGAPLLLTLGLVIAATTLWFERAHLLRPASIAVDGDTQLSKTALAQIDHSVALTRERIDKTVVQGSGSIHSGNSSAPAGFEGSSAKDNIVHSPPLLKIQTAKLDVPPLGRQVQSSAGAPIPTRAITSVLTPATPLQSATGPNLTPVLMHDTALTEQPRASTAAGDIATAVDARRARIRADAGDDDMRRGEYDRAITSYEEALAISPGDEQLERRIERARRARATEAQILWPSSP